MWEYIHTDELYHHGIKGMKWGIRRFQYKDGSLTAAGKKRYYDTPELQSQKNELDKAKSDYKQASAAYDAAYTKYSYFPSKANRQKMQDAYDKRQDSKVVLDRSKLRYSTNREVARIQDKGITFDNKSKHRLKLEDEYKKLGMTDEQAQAAANKRIRTERIIAAAAAVTVAACAAYAANKYVKNHVDGIIKAGESLQRIEMQDTNGKLHDVFYVAKGKHDSTRYKNLLGATRQKQTGHAFLMKLESKADIKVASKDNASKIFGDLYKNDEDFRRQVRGYVSEHFGGNTIRNIDNLSERNIKKMYENFNSALINVREDGSGADQKFYNALKKAGYGAIQDINDMKYSGYSAKNPLIVFGNKSAGNVMVKSVSEIKENMAASGQRELGKALVEQISKDLTDKALPASAVVLTTAAVTTRVSKPDQKKYGSINR